MVSNVIDYILIDKWGILQDVSVQYNTGNDHRSLWAKIIIDST